MGVLAHARLPLPTGLRRTVLMKICCKEMKKEMGKASAQPNKVSSRIPLIIKGIMSKSKSVAALPCTRPFAATHMLFLSTRQRCARILVF